ncbi:hypothetical protein D3C76_1579390 [compost metagenome]
MSIDFGTADQIVQRMAPVCNLLQWVDILSRRPFTRTKVSMVMHEHDKASLCEGPRKGFQPVLLDRCISMTHGDRRVYARCIWREKPAAQHHTAFTPKLDITSYRHLISFAFCN